MMFPAPIYLLIQIAGLYGALRLGAESTTLDDKSKKCRTDVFKGGFKGMWNRNPINLGLVIAFLLATVLIAFTNTSTMFSGFGMGGGYGGGGGYY